MLSQRICLHLLIELRQVFGQCLPVFSEAEGDCEQIHQCWGTLHQTIIKGLPNRWWLLQAAVHAYTQWRGGMWAILEGLHHGNVIEGTFPFLQFLFRQFPEDASLYSVSELAVELFNPSLPSFPYGAAWLLWCGVARWCGVAHYGAAWLLWCGVAHGAAWLYGAAWLSW